MNLQIHDLGFKFKELGDKSHDPQLNILNVFFNDMTETVNTSSHRHFLSFTVFLLIRFPDCVLSNPI